MNRTFSIVWQLGVKAMKIKQIQWKKFLVKISLWLATEIILNFVGLDNLADYSEFVFERDAIIVIG